MCFKTFVIPARGPRGDFYRIEWSDSPVPSPPGARHPPDVIIVLEGLCGTVEMYTEYPFHDMMLWNETYELGA